MERTDGECLAGKKCFALINCPLPFSMASPGRAPARGTATARDQVSAKVCTFSSLDTCLRSDPHIGGLHASYVHVGGETHDLLVNVMIRSELI